MFEDQSLVNYVVQNKIPVTMCPLASVAVEYFKDIKEVPVKKALDLGIIVSINSDDPAYFGGYINENYEAIAEALNLNFSEIKQIAKNSFLSSFWSSKEKYISNLEKNLT
jgi:Adenosine deaminase